MSYGDGTPYIMTDISQRSGEWHQERIGRITSSRIASACAVLKRASGEAAERRNLRIEMIGEMMTGEAAEHYVSPAMQAGIDGEDDACREYELLTGNDVRRVGFIIHPNNPHFGCSPDRLIGEDGILEAKVPLLTTHIGYLLAGVVPEEYIPQCQWQMGCSSRMWCDFISYCPKLPESMQLFVKRLPRDDAFIAELESGGIKFLAELDDAIKKLKGVDNA